MGADSSFTNWQPPAGYASIPSQVTGIEVYAPAPKEEAPQEETRTFKCRQCGGVIAYDPSQRQLTCPYCGSEQTIEAEQVGRRADEFEFTLETMEKAQHGWGQERRELVCESCGATVTVAPDALTDTCAFCGSNRVLARETVSDALRPTVLVPFTVDRPLCQSNVTDWLGRGWMHPPELSNVRAFKELAGIYLPYWTFDTDVRASWRAEVGTERTERYYQDGEWKSRTVIDWHWRTGQVHLSINDHLVPGTGPIPGHS